MMGQLSAILRRVEGGHGHWCPGCEEMHVIPDGWTFDGDVNSPTFAPSVKITGRLTVKVRGEWTGEWVRDADGKAVDMCCHYFLRAGQLQFCADSSHALAGQTLPCPDIPADLSDAALGV